MATNTPAHQPAESAPETETELAAIAAQLAGECDDGDLHADPDLVDSLRLAILGGGDPLGDWLCQLRAPEIRRRDGAVYTPKAIVDAMVRWATGMGRPSRVVDAGAGTGRFLLSAGQVFPNAALVAVETDPLALAILRANARVLELDERLSVLPVDYRGVALPQISGTTLFLGNPPYVRHHGISKEWKEWFADGAQALGLKASRLAGMHVHFLLKTRQLARDGDFGAFITSSEWLDVNYGRLVRELFTGVLGGRSLHVIEPGVLPFEGTATTGAIMTFRAGEKDKCLRVATVGSPHRLRNLGSGRRVSRTRLAGTDRWSPLVHRTSHAANGGIQLGELCRVHRGQVTGCNRVWVADAYPDELPGSVLTPTVTKARELFASMPCLSDDSGLRRVVDLPLDLDELDSHCRSQVDKFLAWARANGADRSYIARHRRSWWAVSLAPAAPILCTYMARRAPAFVRNACGARHLNIAHGLYPRDALDGSSLDALANWLQQNVPLSAGRQYAGGLTKFEPGEVERITVPRLDSCEYHANAEADGNYRPGLGRSRRGDRADNRTVVRQAKTGGEQAPPLRCFASTPERAWEILP